MGATKATDTMDKAIDLEMRRQELHEETLKEIKKVIVESNRLHDKVEIIADVRVDWSENGVVYLGEVTSTEARIFYEGKKISQVQLKTLTTDKLIEILLAVNASI